LKVQIGKKGEKIPLTGDDLIIEYCDRLMIALKQNNETLLKPSWKSQLESFFAMQLSGD
jgi:hypothetical protein